MVEKKTGLPKWVIGAGALVILVIILGVWVVGIYNGETIREKNVDGAWGDVHVQYQRRFDLIPNLINTVKGVAGFESDTLTQLTALRSQWQSQPAVNDQINTANQFESTLSKLLVITENYPTLQATQSFQDLMVELEGTENRIAVARTRYNDAVREYNIFISLIPNSLFVGGNAEKPFFESASGADVVPTVPDTFI